jgi:hypothetical protein
MFKATGCAFSWIELRKTVEILWIAIRPTKILTQYISDINLI